MSRPAGSNLIAVGPGVAVKGSGSQRLPQPLFQPRRGIAWAQLRVEGRLLTWLINRVPRFYERFVCWMLPANEVWFELEPQPLAPARGSRR